MVFLNKKYLVSLIFFLSLLFSLSFASCEINDSCSECPQLFDTKCFENNTGYYICSDIDGDDCLEWVPEFVCVEGKVCVDGGCVDEPGPGDDGDSGSSSGSSSGSGSSSSGSGSSSSGSGSGDSGDDSDDDSGGGTIDLDDEDEESGGLFWIFVFGFIGLIFLCLAIWLILWMLNKKSEKNLEQGAGKVGLGNMPFAKEQQPLIKNKSVQKIEALLEKGNGFLNSGNTTMAQGVYRELKTEFDAMPNKNPELFSKIKSFYDKIVG